MIEDVQVAVIGTGFAGLCLGVRLRQAGNTDFVLLERAQAVGGTWRDNTYPGAACDVPSQLYSFSFAPNPTWSRSFSGQPEIRDYLEQVTDTFGLRPHLRLGAELISASWDGEQSRWQLETSAGRLRARVLVSAAGALSEPRIPDLPGLAGFPGPVFHSAAWDHGVDLAGKRVAVVGTGASAIQFVPKLAEVAREVVLFQRTPPWILPRADRPLRPWEQRLFARVPAAQKMARAGVYALREAGVVALVRQPALMATARREALRHLRRQVADPQLRALLTPDYQIGCKRILLSNDYYPALCRPQVSVVASGVARVEGDTVVAADGTRRPVDAIVFGTGFQATDLPIAHRIVGPGGRTLAQEWSTTGLSALRGTAVAGFPNFYLLVGPNTGLGHSSMVYMIESQVAYVLDALRVLGDAVAAPSPRAQEVWNRDVQRRMARTVWSTGGCSSWYVDSAGRNTTLWPGATWRFRRQTRRFRPEEFEVHDDAPARRSPAGAVA